MDSKRGHVVMLPLPVAGHFYPFVQILYHLNSACPGLIVSIAVGSRFARDFDALRSNGDFGSLELRVEEIPGRRPPQTTLPPTAKGTCEQFGQEMESLRKKMVALRGTAEAPTSIICDMYLVWCKEFAAELGVPWYSYASGSSLWTLIILEQSKITKSAAKCNPGMASQSVTNSWNKLLREAVPDLVEAPGLDVVRVTDFPPGVFDYPEYYEQMVESMADATALLHNTAEALEISTGAISAIKAILGSSKVLCIGPSVQVPGFGRLCSPEPPATSSVVLPWLDRQERKSVLYVSFGSIVTISKGAILELAMGLEASGVPFLWILQAGGPEEIFEVLPAGFLERTAERGLVETRWVAQISVLEHEAVGGFLTHCGWNSILEGICSGVPFVAWPLAADQHLNARYVHEMAKIGIAVSYLKEENKFKFDSVSRKEIVLAIRALMLEEEGLQLRKNVEDLQRFVSLAVGNGGSSHHDFHTFLDQIRSQFEEGRGSCTS